MAIHRIATSQLTEAATELPEVLSCKEAAHFCRVCTRTIRRWVAVGRLPAARTAPISGRLLIPKRDLIRLLTGQVN
jgi:excisionase family DNA binding protein